MTASVLDNPVWHALRGGHAPYAEARGAALRYAPDVSVFAALPDEPDAAAWRDLAALLGPGGEAVLLRRAVAVPPGWERLASLPGVQLVAGPGVGRPDPEAVALGPGDVAEVTALVEATRPGPWRPRTIELGRFVGLRREGRLVAVAGQRFCPDGHVEISAVGTDPAHRGQGLAGRLVRDLVHHVAAAGGTAIIQAAADNVGAIRLYEHLGFTLRTPLAIEVLRPA